MHRFKPKPSVLVPELVVLLSYLGTWAPQQKTDRHLNTCKFQICSRFSALQNLNVGFGTLNMPVGSLTLVLMKVSKNHRERTLFEPHDLGYELPSPKHGPF